MLIILRILAFLGVLWILRRIFSMLTRNPATSNPGEAPPGNTVKDPVCGMYMDPRLAIRLQRHGEGDLFFCSEECRRRYLTGPN
jgi:YHS domain-containing protein